MQTGKPQDQSGTETFDVSYVAHLSRISLSDHDKKMFQQQLEHILDHVKKLNELNVDDVAPMAHAIPVENCFREDVPVESIDHEAVMKNAPEARHDLFFVPRILE